MEAIKQAAKPLIIDQSQLVEEAPIASPTTNSDSTSSTSQSIMVAETSKVIETTPEKQKQPTTSTLTTTITATVTTTKSISKSKAIPQVPPFKSKMTTHTRTEQESLLPLLPLRGGSSTSTTVIPDIISPKVTNIPKSLPVVRNLVEPSDDDSSQILDTGAKAPNKAAWFVVLWTFVCSWCSDLAQDIRGLFALLWASVILRLPFFTSSTKGTKTKSASSARPPMKKPTAAKYFKGRPMKSESHEGKMRK